MVLYTPSQALQNGLYYCITITRLALKKGLEPSHGVLQLLKKKFYSVLILHLLKHSFQCFMCFKL